MKRIYVIGIALLLAGCAAHRDEPVVLQQWKPVSAPKAGAMFQRSIVPPFSVSVAVSSAKLCEYARSPEEAVAQWKCMGLREIFFQFSSPDFLKKGNEEGKTLKQLFSLLRANGMTGGLWIREIDWRCPERGLLHGRISRRSGAESRIMEDWKKLLDAQKEREDGGIFPEKLVLELSCRTYTKQSRRTPDGTLYAWSDTGYGKNGENALLLEDSVRANHAFGALFGIPVVLAAECDILAAGRNGRLPGADPAALLEHFDRLIVIDRAARPAVNARNVLALLTDERISAGIRPALHSAFHADGLRRRSWSDFVSSFAFLQKKWNNGRCRNVVIADFDRLEALLECAESEFGK